MPSNITTIDQLYKDLFPLPGQPVKEWVLKARAERAEIERTGKRVAVAPHDDNIGDPCREVGPRTLVHDLGNHDCCYTCNEQADRVEHVERIETGALPMCLVRAEWHGYAAGTRLADDWDGWCRAWRDVAYVRLQGFERDAEAIGAEYG